MKNEKIKFRKKAILTYTGAQSLNDRIQIVSAKSWLVFLGFAVILLLILGWAIFGTISTRVYGQGILAPQNGEIISIIIPELGGYVKSLKVNVGDKVTEQTIVAEIVNPGLNSNISESQSYLAKLKSQQEILKNQTELAVSKNVALTNDKISALAKIIQIQKVKLSSLNHLVNLKLKAFQKGLITEESLTETRVAYFTLTQEISEKTYTIVTLKQELAEFKDKWAERIRTQDALIQETTFQLNKLLKVANLLANLHAPSKGTVVTIYRNPGDFIDKGEVLLTVVKEQPTLEAWVYVPVAEGKYVKAGMIAHVSPSTVKKAEFGSMVGEVINVSLYPAGEETLLAVLKDKTLATRFLQKGPLIAIKIKLKKGNTYSGYQWTSSKGPKQKVTQGTLVEASIVIKKQKPFSLVLPLAKQLVQ